MKKTLFLFLIALTIGVHAQIDKGFSLSLSSGITTPTGDYQKYIKKGDTGEPLGFPIDFYGYTKERTGKSQFNIDASYQFGGFGAGLSFGKFKHEISSLVYELDFPTLLQGGEIDGMYYGIGPDYAFSFGKLKMISSIRAGMMNLDIANFTASYNGDDTDVPIEILSTTLNPKNETSLTYSSFGLQFSYPVLKKLNLFVKADYFSTFGDGIQVDDNYYLPFNLETDDNEITIEDVEHFTLPDFLETESRFIKPQMFNIGVGLSYTFGGNKRIKRPAKNTSLQQEEKPQQQEEKARKIVLTYPENGSQFKDGKTFKKFKWEVLGKDFDNPNYVIEVKSISKRGKTYTGDSKETAASVAKVFQDEKLSGQYVWRVIETKTGESSDFKSFTSSDCKFTMTVTNVEIECIGYVGSDRKYKICFDSTYESSVGDLTYNNTGSGLSVYDQSYGTLAYNLVSPNTALLPQIGASTTTVSYCFETLVDSNVTSIGFALQGDDLDPSPVTCQPGISNGVEELPSCICDECDDININFDNFNITSDTQNPSVFTFDGAINVNKPIYGLEFQVLSINYSSSPSACSNGVTSVESSGMFLQAGTSINNSSSIQFINESASQSPNSNNNASKNIKYLSNSALNGAIPVSLNIGLPQPIQGLDTGCCQIDYELCMKVKILYEDGTCKTCTQTKCFNFNNQ